MKNDMPTIMYTILTELYENMKAGTATPPEDISNERFGIPYSYWIDIIIELQKMGLVCGVLVRETKTARLVSVESMRITYAGVEFLSENSTMRKIHDALKGVKDILPGI